MFFFSLYVFVEACGIKMMMHETSRRLVVDHLVERSTSAIQPFIFFSSSFSSCRFSFPMQVFSSLFSLNDEYLSCPTDTKKIEKEGNLVERLPEHSNQILWIYLYDTKPRQC
jgi:hypothetical protein